MYNDEPKKKIVDIIQMKLQECPFQPIGITYGEAAEYVADALIATGIGDVSKYKKHRVFVEKSPTPTDDYYVLPNTPPRIKQLYDGEEVEQIVKEREEYKHRAEVAEWALKDRAAYCATYCVMEGTDYFSLTSVAIEARAKELYKSWRRKAEKELAEERKDD